jgi:hypothetical protein
VLCEINVSSVFAIPEQAPETIARLVKRRGRYGCRGNAHPSHTHQSFLILLAGGVLGGFGLLEPTGSYVVR